MKEGKEKREKERERIARRKDGQRKIDGERVAQWNVYCPRCGPLAGYIRAHPPLWRACH